MDSRIQVVLMVVFIQIPAVLAMTNSNDVAALRALRDMWENYPPSWNDTDPCDSSWEGIGCSDGRVTSLILNSMDLQGKLSGDIAGLTELHTLDLSYNKNLTGSLPTEIESLKKLAKLVLIGCNFFGHIPDTIGSLPELVLLFLNSNSFSGEIPSSIGNLAKLIVLDISDNQLTGTIPISDGISPGLDMLIQTQHFHFGKNQLSGPIPDQLFSPNMALIHLLLDNNKFTGSIPPRLGLVKNLTVVRLDRNSLSGHVPSNLSNLTKVTVLFLSNNELTGPVPDLTDMYRIKSIDMSNNSFQSSDFPPWFSTLQSLTTLKMERTELSGTIPDSLFSLPDLQTVMLRKNSINGTLDLGTTSFGVQLRLVDLRENQIGDFTPPTGHDIEIMLVGNPVCRHGVTEDYCMASDSQSQSNALYSTSIPTSCMSCNSSQSLSPNCTCAYPYIGTLSFRGPSFSNLGNTSYFISLETSLMQLFQDLPVLSVSLSNLTTSDGYLKLRLQVFPRGKECFNITGIYMIGNKLSSTFQPPDLFGSFSFVADTYLYLEERSSSSKPKGMNTDIVIGVAAGCSLVVLLLLLAGVYAIRQKRRAERATEQSNPFAKWDRNQSSGSIPHLQGARRFSFEEIKKCTNNFSEANSIGTGGYGKVYRGILSTGQMVAIKRAKQGSMQGSLEFKTEIELLSRVHHKNVVGLVGFCFQRSEQMLVYEYVANGTLRDCLTGKLGIRLDWIKRLKVALGAARGLAYLHELAEPPIIHRDIKSNNILLDERLNAKVSDFGLSKLMADGEKDHVTTQVKGTMGYMDPEYYLSQQLTDKSDVYSFGVLMLELLTARKPIERGKYIVKEVKSTIDRTKNLYTLHDILDPTMGTTLGGFDKFVDLALSCVEESGVDRPTMGEVVKEIENIMQLAGLHPNADSASTSASYEESSMGTSGHPYGSDVTFDNSCGHSPSKVEPK